MKSLKRTLVLTVLMVLAAISLAATRADDSRPPDVAENQWVALSDRTGFKVVASYNDPVLTASLYVKTDGGWQRARLVTPLSAIPLERK